MKNKNLLLVIIIMTLITLNASAQQLITSVNELRDGELIAIIGENSDGYYPLSSASTQKDKTIHYNIFDGDKKIPTIYEDLSKKEAPFEKVESAIFYSHIFRVVKDGDKWQLFDTSSQHYLYNKDKENAEYLSNKEDIPSTYQGLTYVPFKDGTGIEHNWKFGNKHLILEGYNYFMEDDKTAEKLKSSTCAVNLYEVNDVSYGYTFGDEGITKDINIKKKPISLYKELKNETYNVIAFPFDIVKYQYVFGFNAIAYEPIASDKGVNYVKIEGNGTLKANTPYIIAGTLFESPYILPYISVNYNNASSTVKKTINGINFEMVYNNTDISDEDFSILSKGNICSSKAEDIKVIKPFDWVFTTEEGQNSKTITLEGAEIQTGIERTISKEDIKDKFVYNIQGIKVANSESELNKTGIFIVNGKKIVR